MTFHTALYFLISSFLFHPGGDGKAKKQIVTFSGLENSKGRLYIGWYNNADDFRKPGKAILQRVEEVKGVDSHPVVFADIPAGTYAIAVFFDENGNGKMDTNFLGIPKEKYGFSNNVFPLTRAASFKEAAFIVTDEDGSIYIRLK